MRVVVLMELYNNINDFENNSHNSTNNNSNFLNTGFVNRILNIINLKTENNRLDIGGLSLDIDNIVVIGVLFFLITDNSYDILLIICLGLSLLDVNLNPF